MTTLKDIARHTKLDISTISRSLNDSSRVNLVTKNYVRRVAQELGYKKNEIARSLATKKTNTIGVIVADISSPFFSELTKGIEYLANENGYSILLCDADWDTEREKKYLEILTSRKVDGLLVHTCLNSKENFLDIYRDIKIPLVLLANTFEGIDYYHLGIDNFKGAYEVTSYLISLGHKKILHVTNKISTRWKHYKIMVDRMKGYRQALEDAGIKYREELVLELSHNFSSVHEGVREYFKKNRNSVTAVFAGSDWSAIGVIKALQDLGLKVPGDFSVAGFDNVKIGSIFNPALTTYDQPKYRMGIKAIEILVDLLNGKKPKEKEYIIESEGVIVRDSCAANKK